MGLFVVVIATLASLACLACRTTLPRPDAIAHRSDETPRYQMVAYPPPPAEVEGIPEPAPVGGVWIDGEWRWQVTRWIWQSGGWLVPPSGARHAKWLLIRDPQGRLFFLPSCWRDHNGEPIADPPMVTPARPAR